MPKRSPFTSLCGRLGDLASPRRVDLHIHTTASDGEFTPEQVVALGRQANLAAVAITDHDTLAAVEIARHAAGSHIELVPGVEISAEFERREVHLLGYFIRADHEPLNAALARLCDRRRDRFRDFIVRLGSQGMPIPEDRVRIVEERTASLGRRHVVGLLLACQFARHRAEAFQRIVGPLTRDVLAKELLPLE
ncbi:MAG TPA: PHP domain-containing protein, partial [Gemmata sp.]|nr:PHP domain-containing protein [Gemmata sp.]